MVDDVVLTILVTLSSTTVDAVPDKFPENTSVVSTLVAGLNCNVASEETATPDAPFTGENNM